MKLFDLSPKDLGPFIRERRESLKVTQQDLADATHLSQSQVSKVEAGKADLGFADLKDVMNFLSVEISFKQITVKP